MKRSEHGFSLIELTFVIAIMAVALVVIVSRIEGAIPSARLDSQCRKMCAFIEAAFSRAAASGKPVCIIYDLNANTYYLAFPRNNFDDNPERMDKFEENHLPKSIHIEQIAFGDDVESSGIHVVKATPNGRIKGHSIFIRDDNNRKKTIEVAPLTGMTRVYDGFLEVREELDVE